MEFKDLEVGMIITSDNYEFDHELMITGIGKDSFLWVRGDGCGNEKIWSCHSFETFTELVEPFLEVGQKYVDKTSSVVSEDNIVTVLYVGSDVVVFKYMDDYEHVCSVDRFTEDYKKVKYNIRR